MLAIFLTGSRNSIIHIILYKNPYTLVLPDLPYPLYQNHLLSNHNLFHVCQYLYLNKKDNNTK